MRSRLAPGPFPSPAGTTLLERRTMLRLTRPWRGVGTLTLAFGGMALAVGAARAGDGGAPLARQLTELGRQALAQGDRDQARAFFRKALELDPADPDARRGLRA